MSRELPSTSLIAAGVIVIIAFSFPGLKTLASPILCPANGRYYEFVRFVPPATSNTWFDAQAVAAGRTFAGMKGRLATITSIEVNEFIRTNFATGTASEGAWLGGRAAKDDGIWRWVCGPEAGTQFALWKQPTPPYNFANWGGIEPNHTQADENYLVFNVGLDFNGIPTGQWWDAVPAPWRGDPVVGYLVQYEPGTVPRGCEPTLGGTLPCSVNATNAYASATGRVATLTVYSNLVTDIRRNTNGSVTLTFAGFPNSATRLWIATNLTPPTFWQPMFTNNNMGPGGIWQVTDTNTAGHQTRFYRFSTP